MRRELLLTSALLAAVLAACAPAGDHGHDDGEDSHAHGDDDHGHAHDAGGHGEDDHGEDAHGHGGGVVVTDFTETAELFVEFPPFAVGRDSPFAAHFTRLDDFSPVADGQVIVRLAGGGAPEEVFTASPSPTAGIFSPVARPRHAVTRDVTVILQAGDLVSIHSLGRYDVFGTVAEADASLPADSEDETLIPFLKEQQWQVDFATAEVRQAGLYHSVRAPATLEPAPGGDASVTAQLDGVVLAAGETFPQIGDVVEQGDVIARIAPNLVGERDYASLVADRDAARAAYTVARAEQERVASLFEAGAVSRSRVDQAEAELQTSRARLNAAQARLEGASGGTDGGVAVRAPVSGRIARMDVRPGSYAQSGDALFRIVDPSRMRLVAQIAEIDAPSVGQPQGAWFTLLGHDDAYDLSDHGGRLVAAGGAVDPVRRTMPVIFEFANDEGFAAGALASARIRTSERFDGPVIPASAIVDESGQAVVFVMEDGENGRRQPIRIAVRDGDLVGVASGLEPGDRIVSTGAYLVHLAASGPAEAGHGHAH